jgi:hypothetical protein
VPFELNIAVKRSPIEQSGRESVAEGTPRPVTMVVEVSGALTVDGATDIIQRLDTVVTHAQSSVILRFVGDVHVSPDDVGPIEVVAAWLKYRRCDGCSLYVDVTDARAREVFERVDDIRAAMLPVGSDPAVPRRNVPETLADPDGDSAR